MLGYGTIKVRVCEASDGRLGGRSSIDQPLQDRVKLLLLLLTRPVEECFERQFCTSVASTSLVLTLVVIDLA